MTVSSGPAAKLTEGALRARRARYFLYAVGAAFVAIGFALDMVPVLAAVAAPLAARLCALTGAVILTLGRFGSDRLVSRCRRLVWNDPC